MDNEADVNRDESLIPATGAYLHIVDGIGYVDWTATDSDKVDLLTRCLSASGAMITIAYDLDGKRKIINDSEFAAARKGTEKDLQDFILTKLGDLSDGENIQVLAINTSQTQNNVA